jgi:OmcA/MtrC family decaheme c-type cytochrome
MPDGQYTFTWTNGNQFNFSIGFPGFMNNCSTCHVGTQLTAATAAPASYALCISCHDTIQFFVDAGAPTAPALMDHRTFTSATDCSGCHANVNEFHNGLMTERAGLIWNGADQSVVQGQRIAMSIDNVAVTGGNLVITWSATLDGTAVNPCNTTVTDTAPGFVGITANAATGQVASNMSVLQAYAQANDWVNGISTVTSPGQPVSTNMTTTNTVCTGNVATTTVAAATTSWTKGVVSLQGKPQLGFSAAATTNYGPHAVIQVRSASPTREFVVATGNLPAASDQRRHIVDTAKCLACHLGSLYQHGGNRVDRVELCVMCHNPASSEQQNRVNMGVTAAEAYDGKAGETYDLRTMVHAIHSAGETGEPLAYYRSNGIYFFGARDEAGNTNLPASWPTTGGVTCLNAEGANVTYYEVAGSVANGTSDRVPTVNGDGTCNTTTGPLSTGGVWRIHNFIPVHYPRALNDCSACHADGWEPSFPDATKAVGVTFDAGAAPWYTLNDDALIGPSAASCMTCHQSGDPQTQYFLRQHAYDNGWTPSVFPNGRQTLLDAVKY